MVMSIKQIRIWDREKTEREIQWSNERLGYKKEGKLGKGLMRHTEPIDGGVGRKKVNGERKEQRKRQRNRESST